jgi:hypothetical protein
VLSVPSFLILPLTENPRNSHCNPLSDLYYVVPAKSEHSRTGHLSVGGGGAAGDMGKLSAR